MKAKDVMSTPAICVTPQTPIKEVAALMVTRRIGAVPVVDEAGDLLGAVTESELAGIGSSADPRAQALPVTPPKAPRTAADAMQREVLSLPESADIAWIARLMHDEDLRWIPITDGDKVVGVVARRDLLRVLIRTDEEIRSELQYALDHEPALMGRAHVEVAEGIATLTGVDNRFRRGLAERVARAVPGVVDVISRPPILRIDVAGDEVDGP